jgi:hypothetical protein
MTKHAIGAKKKNTSQPCKKKKFFADVHIYVTLFDTCNENISVHGHATWNIGVVILH